MVRHRTEARGHPVDGTAGGDGPFDDPAALSHRLPGVRGEGNCAPAPDDREELLEGEGATVQRQSLGHRGPAIGLVRRY
jgi:hypothetical protein